MTNRWVKTGCVAVALFLSCAAFARGEWIEAGSASELACGASVTNLFADTNAVLRFTVVVAPETQRFEVRLSGGRGDADVYLRREAPPTAEAFDLRPFVEGSEELARLDLPAAGVWHIAVHAASAFEELTLTVRCRGRAASAAAQEIRSPRDMELALYYELAGVPPREEVWSAELRNQALREEGRAAFTAGDFEKAVRAWTRWQEVDPTNPEPVSLIGDIFLRRGQIDRAIEHYRRSLDIQPGQIGLMVRLARLIDQELKQPVESRNLLNLYSRLFPNNPDVTLAQAEWLLWRRRYDEAGDLIRSVIDNDWENLRARSLIHGLLRTPEERFANMQAMLAVGDQPGMEAMLAQAINDHGLLTRPESWVLMDFVDRLSLEAPYDALRDLAASLLPRETVATEDFRLGRMSRNWISSRELMWNEEGNVVLSADISQSEAYLRLAGSDALHNAFIEAEIDNARGFFWLYARRGEGNMIRFGFDETGLMYQQIWMNGQLRYNESRLWSKPPGLTKLRLEVRADGAYAQVDGRPAFGSPMSIPRDMGLGWWGVAPWSPELGRAAVTVRRVSGGPLPVRIARVSEADLNWAEPRLLDRLQRQMRGVQALAPDWYARDESGAPARREGARDLEMRMLARYYRARLMPQLTLADFLAMDPEQVRRVAERDRLDGYTLIADKMPAPRMLAEMEARAIGSDLAFLIVLMEPDGGHAVVHEINPNVGLFPGPRHPRRLPVGAPEAEIPSSAEGMLISLK